MEIARHRGIGVSPGIAMGEALLAQRADFVSRKESIPASRVKAELARLDRAIVRTRGQLQKLKSDIKVKLGDDHAFIFDAHLLILDDRSMRISMEKIVRDEKARAEWALSQVNKKYKGIFESLKDEYFRQRQFDLSDVLFRIQKNLQPTRERKQEDMRKKILIAHDLLPSEAAHQLSEGGILGVALDTGGQTSHAALLARSLNIPTVVGLHDVTAQVKSGDTVIVDGTDGEVIVNPPSVVRKEFESKRERYDTYRRELKKTARLAPITLDQVRFSPMANIELPEEVSQAFSLGAEGIGLFRSEFLYLQSSTLPSEEDHFRVYSRLAKAAYPLPVYIRTVDIGGEKPLPQLMIEQEPNPALGLRAVRLSLKYRGEFRVQLRAVLRASFLKNIRVLIPMITEVEEVGEVKILFQEVQEELKSEGVKFDEKTPLGVMIEVPAAAALVDVFVHEVDFLSIGTNDLIQYYLAVDRSNEFVSHLYKPLHPSVLRLLRSVIDTALRADKEITVCGEMAADPLSALILLGFGLRKFSMNPIFIPRIKKVLRAVEFKTVRQVVNRAMEMRTAQEVEEYLLEKVLLKHPRALLLSQMNLVV